MGKSILIMGASKAGKTTSIRTLDPKKTVVFSPLAKGLPFEGSGKDYIVRDQATNPDGNLIRSSSSQAIVKWLKHISTNMLHVTVCVIDDNTFITAKELDRRRDEAGYRKYNDIAHDILEITEVANSLRPDLNVYFLHHTKVEGDGILEKQQIKAASFGKLVDEKYQGLEAQFEIVFLATKVVEGDDNISYRFKTKDANSTIGTPMGMFDEEYIDNDLQAVNERINCFYNGDCKDAEGTSVVVTKITKSK